jgi:hypothetical protein
MKMHTYLKDKDEELWTVGFSSASGGWRPMKDFDTEGEAASYVSFLNGGQNAWEKKRK